MSSSKGTAKQASSMPVKILKGALIGSVLSIVLILIYAVALMQGWLDEASMPVVNSVIKALCAAAAALLAIRGCGRRKWIIGAITGAVYIVMAFVVFSILSGQVSFSVAVLSDLLLGVLAGMLTAMLSGLFR